MQGSPKTPPKSILRSIAWWIGVGILAVTAVFSGVGCISFLNEYVKPFDADAEAVCRIAEPEELCVEDCQCEEKPAYAHKTEDIAKENMPVRYAASMEDVCILIGCFIVLLLCVMTLILLLRRRGMRILWGLCLSTALGGALSLCGLMMVIGAAWVHKHLTGIPLFDWDFFSLSMFFGVMAVLCIGVGTCFALAHAAWRLVLYIWAKRAHLNNHE